MREIVKIVTADNKYQSFLSDSSDKFESKVPQPLMQDRKLNGGSEFPSSKISPYCYRYHQNRSTSCVSSRKPPKNKKYSNNFIEYDPPPDAEDQSSKLMNNPSIMDNNPLLNPLLLYNNKISGNNCPVQCVDQSTGLKIMSIKKPNENCNTNITSVYKLNNKPVQCVDQSTGLKKMSIKKPNENYNTNITSVYKLNNKCSIQNENDRKTTVTELELKVSSNRIKFNNFRFIYSIFLLLTISIKISMVDGIDRFGFHCECSAVHGSRRRSPACKDDCCNNCKQYWTGNCCENRKCPNGMYECDYSCCDCPPAGTGGNRKCDNNNGANDGILSNLTKSTQSKNDNDNDQHITLSTSRKLDHTIFPWDPRRRRRRRDRRRRSRRRNRRRRRRRRRRARRRARRRRRCTKGKFGNNGEHPCKSCTAGQYQPSGGKKTCISCGQGQYTSSTEQVACSNCPTGWAASSKSTYNNNKSCESLFYNFFN